MFEQPQLSPEGLTEEQKEARLRKSKLFRLRGNIQNAVMDAEGMALSAEDNVLSMEHMHAWAEQGYAQEFKEVFDELSATNENLLSEFESDPEAVIALFKEKIDEMHVQRHGV